MTGDEYRGMLRDIIDAMGELDSARELAMALEYDPAAVMDALYRAGVLVRGAMEAAGR